MDSDDEFDFMDYSDDELGKPVRKMPNPAAKTEGQSRVPRLPPAKPNAMVPIKSVSRFIMTLVKFQSMIFGTVCFFKCTNNMDDVKWTRLLFQEEVDEKELLEAHKAHWRQVKQDWVDAAFANEKRYDKSIKMIEDIYKRAQELYNWWYYFSYHHVNVSW